MFDKVKKAIRKGVTWLDNGAPHDGMQNDNSPTGFYTPIPLAYTFYKGTTFDNTYPSVKALVNEFSTIEPYAIDSNGKPLNKANVIDCLYRPNLNMSATNFRGALAVMTLVHPKVYLLLWRKENGFVVPGGKITEENLAGFTFLEGAIEMQTGEQKYYQCRGKTYNTDEVIEIFLDYNPYNLGRGYAPTGAVKKWADLDDYIAAYEAGLFENDAVPSGQFLITAKTPDEFKQIVRGMQNAHRGAGKNNNVSYVHRPVDPATGTVQSAQIEWVPFARTNKEMSLDVIFKQANDKIDSAFGVPASIRGVNENKGYAAVRIDEQNFMKYAVKPLATKIYSRLNHELNRITGGLGYAISFELEIPGVAEEEKTMAERKLTEFNLINTAVANGYSLDSVVDAFELPNSYKLLKTGYQAPVIVNDKPEVDEGGEVENAPGGEDEKKAKVAKHTHVCNHSHKIVAQDEGVVEEIAKIVRGVMSEQIEAVIERGNLEKDVEGMTPEEMAQESQEEEEKRNEELAAAILAAVLVYMMQQGEMSYTQGTTLLVNSGVSVENLQGFQINGATKSDYQAYLNNVAKSYNKDTAQKIRNVLAEGQTMGWNKEELATALRGIMKTDEWRVQRLARTEEHRTVNQSSVDAMKQLMAETGAKIYKIWHNNSAEPCEFCAALNKKRELVTGSFLPKGGQVTGANGGTFINTFVDVDAADLHPNCNCYLTYEVEQ